MATTRRGFALVGGLATVIAMIGFGLATSASAAPTYPPPTTPSSTATTPSTPASSSSSGTGGATSSTTTPTAGGSVTLSGGPGSAPANTQIDVSIHTDPVFLGSTTSDAQGAWSITVTIPSSFSGSHTLVATVASTGQVLASVPITVKAASSSSGGGLAATGVAVIGIGSVGLVLLVGGGLMLLAGRRRNGSHASA